MPVASASYGLGAVAFALLALACRRSGNTELRLQLPAAISSVWALLAAGQAWLEVGRELVALLEMGRNLAWLWFLWRGLQRLRDGDTFDSPGLAGLGRGLPLLAATALLAQASALLWPNRLTGLVAYVLLPNLMAIFGMVLVEQFYRNARAQERWGIKFLCLALGGLFAYDFYLYSEAMLFGGVSADTWAARGAVNALLVPLLWVSVRRRTDNRPLAISHRMAFHSVALVGAGIYLMLMAAAGYYLRIVGGDWGTLLQTVFLFGAIALLLVTVFSGVARARLRVFLSKHFFHYRYDYREEWLRFTALLTAGDPGARVHERSLEAMAGLVESPAAALWMKQDDGHFRRVAHWNWSDLNGQFSSDHPFAQFLETSHWVLDLHECEDQPDLLGGATAPTWLAGEPRAWLVIPLFWHESLLGVMVLADSLGKVAFDWEVSDLLKTAARQAAAHLAQARAAEALIVARQFESFNRAAAFVVHDIKNLVAQLTLLLANAQRHKHKPEFQDDMLATIESSVARMNRMLIKLRDKPDAASSREVVLVDLLHEVMRSKSAFSLKPTLEILAPELRVRAEPEKLTRVVGHIVQNAIEATPYTGKVGVTLNRSDHWAEIVVADTGAGMDDAFIRERLFRPFDSTKGTGMGIGAYECKSYIQELGGDITVESQPGQGSRFTLRFPLPPAVVIN
ncbi:MAG: PEP-CTERM system histidine kinase PrsK [Hydrogenophilales bacterium CG_4_9_14_3_um_filter_63_34]|nr:MAG: PEP-CTERM system histidine kinase PrsK [Hydrogenophilales bacterium CG_4_10_14_3_um_filter_63_21]PJB02304.1 MAG: PEP-CTERM system histidine kinase PrsK [Hydrogenophilales bacterium CG_4_9_14_3_um_filter_63_34]